MKPEIKKWVGPIQRIQQRVCNEYGLTMREMNSPRRAKPLIIPRHMAMWLCKKLTMASLPTIGRTFGDRDHTTIIHGIRNIETMISVKPEIKQQAEKLLRSCSNAEITG